MNSYLVNGRPWDSFDGYLFDIDGTLLNCTDAVHYFAFCDALRTLSGHEMDLEGVTAHGNTDVGILRDALALAGIDENAWRPRLPEIRVAMGRFVAQREAELCANSLPHVREVLEHLQARHATLGIATGNLEQIGKLKLRAAGLLDYFAVGGWSDDHESRADVFSAAIKLMRSATHEDAALCVLGDTPADVHAAHVNGLPIIAVCTGIYPRQQLMQTQPELCLHSFADLFASES